MISESEKIVELKLRTLEYLTEEEFWASLKKATDYNRDHPPLEPEMLIGADVPPLEGDKEQVEKINQATREQLLDSHRKRLMVYFRGYRKVPPEELAREIADVIIAEQALQFEQSPCT